MTIPNHRLFVGRRQSRGDRLGIRTENKGKFFISIKVTYKNDQNSRKVATETFPTCNKKF